MEPDEISAFAVATGKLLKRPDLIHKPELGFFKDYLLTLGVRLPSDGAATMQIDLSDSDDGATPASRPADATSSRAPPMAQVQGGVIADSDDEDHDRLPEDLPPFPELPPPRIEDELEEAQVEVCAAAKAAADMAFEAGDLVKSLEKLTQALMTGAASALVFARRGELLLSEGRPCAAIADCSAALEINPDCGKAYRIRGLAARKLGRWEAALRDLTLGQKLDYDEGVASAHKFVAKKAPSLEERGVARGGSAGQAPSAKRRRPR